MVIQLESVQHCIGVLCLFLFAEKNTCSLSENKDFVCTTKDFSDLSSNRNISFVLSSTFWNLDLHP